jgi:1-acyl-sn-glycerol-3-phosphate acyltransferase
MSDVQTSAPASRLTQIVRSVRLLLHIILGLIQSAIYPHLNQAVQRRMAQNWSARLLSILNVKLHCRGEPPAADIRRAMLAANHVSWLDVYSINAICPSRFIAKSEIRGWPFFGWLSHNVGTLFIERSKRSDTARINEHIVEALINGYRVAVFPEGATTDGTMLWHFHASLLQAAVTVEAMLYPVAIRYRDASGEISKAAPYAGISLLQSLKRVLQEQRIDVELIFSAPIESAGKNRRELARGVESAIASALSLPIPHRKPGKSADPQGE